MSSLITSVRERFATKPVTNATAPVAAIDQVVFDDEDFSGHVRFPGGERRCQKRAGGR